jgi:hypothetical protein
MHFAYPLLAGGGGEIYMWDQQIIPPFPFAGNQFLTDTVFSLNSST